MKAIYLFILLLAVTICWKVNRGSHPGYPSNYSGDCKMVLAQIRASADRDVPLLGRVNPKRLGAPFEADWNAYPLYERPAVWLSGKVANTVGLCNAANVMGLLAMLTTAVSMFMAVKAPVEWRILAAALFACSPYVWSRADVGHLWLAFAWEVPLCIVAVSSGSKPMLAFAGLAVGLGNPYNAFFFVQALLVSAFTRREWRKLVWPIAWLSAGFIAQFWPTILADRNNYIHSIRDLQQQELGALQPYLLALPEWSSWFKDIKKSGPPHECQYIGLVACIGLLFQTFVPSLLVVSWAERRNMCKYLLIASMAGGLATTLFVCGGFGWFRSAGRVSAWLCCLGLMHFAERFGNWSLSRFGTSGWRGRVSCVIVALSITVLGMTDQWPKPCADHRTEVDKDMRFVKRLEASLPDGSSVYCWPSIPWPEGGHMKGVDASDNMTVFIWSKHLRTQFGDLSGRGESNWSLAPQTAQDLARWGFSAVALDLRADSVDDLIVGLLKVERPFIVESNLVALRLPKSDGALSRPAPVYFEFVREVSR